MRTGHCSTNTPTNRCTTSSPTFEGCAERAPMTNRFTRAALATAAAAALGAAATAQGLDPATLLNPSPDSWPTYHGDYTGMRHSRLTEITPANVAQLTLAWAFQTGQSASIKS